MNRIYKAALFSGAATITLLPACREDDKSLVAPPVARVLFVQAAPSLGQNAEVYTSQSVSYGTNNRKANLAFGNTAATNPTAGKRSLRIRLTDGAEDAIATDAQLEPYGHYTAIIANLEAGNTAASAPVGVMLLRDDLRPTTGRAKLRFVHLGVEAPAVDVYIFTGSTTPAMPTFSNKRYGQMAPGDANPSVSAGQFSEPVEAPFTEVPEGNYRVEVRPAGAASTSRALISVSQSLAAGRAYTLIARGYLNVPTGSKALAVQAIPHDLPAF